MQRVWQSPVNSVPSANSVWRTWLAGAPVYCPHKAGTGSLKPARNISRPKGNWPLPPEDQG